jgi:hypothetical protein
MAEAKTMSKETKTMMSKIKIALASALVALCALAFASSAYAAFGLKPGTVSASALKENGTADSQAASHPFSVGTGFKLNSVPNPGPFNIGLPISDESALRNVIVEAPPGFVGNPTATPRCTMAEFLGRNGYGSECSDGTQVGIATTDLVLFEQAVGAGVPIYNIVPQPGQPALFAFMTGPVPTVVVPRLRESDYGFDFEVLNIDNTVPVTGNSFVLWGNPESHAHDYERGGITIFEDHGEGPELSDHHCGSNRAKNSRRGELLSCPSGAPEIAFLTNPMDCAHGPFEVPLEVQAWLGQHDSETVTTTDEEGNAIGVTRCDRVPFEPSMHASPTTDNAETATGLDFELGLPEGGILNPEGLAQSDLKKTVVKLPEGITANPSSAEGLGVCTPADYANEKLETPPGAGCPNASKIGTVQIESPLLSASEKVEGSLFLGQPDDPTTPQHGAENPFDSFLAIYIVARVPERGVMVKMAGKVEPDPKTGQLTTTFDNLPPLPFSNFKLHFREGARSPLVSEPTCGEHITEAELYPYARPDEAIKRTSVSLVTKGVGAGACPSGGIPGFKPGFEAGSQNNNAGSYSPFYMRLTRKDGEQDMTKFSSILPPGVLGNLSGVAKCPESALAIAAAKTGRQEQASPSCPADSQIGHVKVGAGVGTVLTYVSGNVYLGGPYHGDPLSVVVITPAVAGPFDVGTVVTREALTLNPKTAEVEVDGAASDPIPHILKGIPLKVRDLRVYVDREHFILNPTSCNPSSAKATLFGSYADVFNPADDVPVALSTRYQPANCLNLGFKPSLSLNLKGGTSRGGHPGLKATYVPKKGDTNIKGLVVRLPRSAFLDQAHIRTICTRVQFAAKACPSAAQYGYVKAWTPLLDEPLQGPVYLRSSNHKLPDMVLDLHGLVDVEVAIRIDSARGGIRATMEDAPDATLSKVLLTMQGQKKGLIVNSKDLCASTNRANVHYEGHNGKTSDAKPELQPDCGGKRKHKRG